MVQPPPTDKQSDDDGDCRAEIPALLPLEVRQQNALEFVPRYRQRWGRREASDEGGKELFAPEEVAEFLRKFAWLRETELALQCLFKSEYDEGRAVELLHSARREKLRSQRDEAERIRTNAFESAMARHGKKFHLMQRKLGRKVTIREIVSKFYLWKHTPAYKRWRQRERAKKKKELARQARLQPADCHNEHCEMCFTGGKLLCCDGCTRAYHLSCVQPPILDVPEGDWFCSHCRDASPKTALATKSQHCEVNTPISVVIDPSALLETISNGSSYEADGGSPVAILNQGGKRGVDDDNDGALGEGGDAEDGLVAVRDPDDNTSNYSPSTEDSSPNDGNNGNLTDNDESDGGVTKLMMSLSPSHVVKAPSLVRKKHRQAGKVSGVGFSRNSGANRSLEYSSSTPSQASSRKKVPLQLETPASSRKRQRTIDVAHHIPSSCDESG
ncbi:hypothetical protein BBJ28_00012011 [Nothophytophthora sp. Chile5]|nr:hypothetical protein BBJ28_00012011 [Nothophytophthora sp. Chile5]